MFVVLQTQDSVIYIYMFSLQQIDALARKHHFTTMGFKLWLIGSSELVGGSKCHKIALLWVSKSLIRANQENIVAKF